MLAPTGAGLLIIRSFIHYYKAGVLLWTPAVLFSYSFRTEPSCRILHGRNRHLIRLAAAGGKRSVLRMEHIIIASD